MWEGREAGPVVGRAQFVGSTVGCLGKLGLDPESLGNPPAGSREDVEGKREGKMLL